jgi:dihydrodipicolinate synthase/N-acetylneuraminate lyase
MDYDRIKSLIRGPAVLAMTPFGPDYELRLGVLRDNLRYIVDGGISKGKGFVIMPCGTGEYNTLTRDEHLRVVETALDACGDDLPVVVGVASTSHKEAIARCQNAARAGATCAMIPLPYYYGGVDQEAVVNWYRVIAEASDIGIMVYDQTWRRLGATVGAPAIAELARIESVVSIKRGAQPDMKAYVESLERFSGRMAFIDNSYGYTAGVSHLHGGAGYITGIGAFWPEIEAEFWGLLEAGKYPEAEALHARQGEFWHFVDGPMRGYATNVLKSCAEYVGLPLGSVRPPFRDLNADELSALHGILRHMGVKARAPVV